MNGYDIAEDIRRRAWGNKVLLIALTGWGQPQDKQAAAAADADAGFDLHMTKPFDIDMLGDLLSRETSHVNCWQARVRRQQKLRFRELTVAIDERMNLHAQGTNSAVLPRICSIHRSQWS